MNLKPLGDRIVVQPIEQEEQTTLGIFWPETSKRNPQQSRVVAYCPSKRQENANGSAMDVKVDDKVLYAKYAGTTIKLDGKELLILKESDILAIVE